MYSYDHFKVLCGPHISLRRLTEDDFVDAVEALYSPTTWVVAVRGITSKEKVFGYLKNFVEKDQKSEGLTLVARLNTTNEVVGISRYHCASPNFSKVEIGFTWIADTWQRTFVNTEKNF